MSSEIKKLFLADDCLSYGFLKYAPGHLSPRGKHPLHASEHLNWGHLTVWM